MSTEIAKRISDGIISDNVDIIKNAYEVIQTMVSEAFLNSTLLETKQQLSDYFEKEDRILGFLNQKCSEKDRSQFEIYYCAGKISGLMDLLSSAAQRTNEQREIQDISNKSKYLVKCLKFVDEQPFISGTDLKRKLGLSDSSFSNYYKRIESYQLFCVHKIGNTNYYSLTPRGRRSLQNATTEGHNQVMYEESFVVSLLEAIAEEVNEDHPNATNVILRANKHTTGSSIKGNSVLMKSTIDHVVNHKRNRWKKPRTGISAKNRNTSILNDYSAYYSVDENNYCVKANSERNYSDE